jgi:hypothetical protein
LVLHEIKKFPRNTQYPVVERRVIGQPAQSESQNALKCNGLLEWRSKPWPGAGFK